MMSAKKYIYSSLVIACLLNGVRSLHAQTSVTDGSTPLALAPGAPAGTYRLSDFENINLFSGSLNFRLPLIAVGGRGEAGHTITLPIERHWTVHQADDPGQPQPVHYANMETWRPIPWMYSGGTLLARKSAMDVIQCGVSTDWSWNKGLTRLTFSGPDGTEYELRDQLTGGAPIDKGCTQRVTRGSVFVTADGTAATFTSDTTIDDTVPPYPATEYGVSGYLRLRNGTRYRIDNGKVSSIRDRNGNLVLFFFDANGRVNRIADSSNREVRISYRPGGRRYDEITFKGFAGTSRVIRIHYDNLLDLLRSGFSLPAPAASSLFPYLLGVPGSPYNFEVVSAVELPDGREYRFQYNYHAELARVELPAGGAYEYDFAGGINGGHSSGIIFGGFSGPLIYRRLVRRRVYDAGGVLVSRTDYSRPETGDVNGLVDQPPQYPLFETTVQVDHRRPNGSLVAREKHTYFGSAAFSLLQAGPSSYPAYREGKEQRVEFYAANGSTLLRKLVTADWQQRSNVSWWTGPAILEPPNDPRLMSAETTLTDANQVSRQTFDYDQHNNTIGVQEYDFGSGAPGPLLRSTETAYLTTHPASGDPYQSSSIHLRNLPVRQTVRDGSGAKQAETLTEYDVYSGTHRAPLASRNSISGLDPAFTASYTARGNATQIRRWITGTNWAETYPHYDAAGNIVRIIDPRLKVTTFTYDDRYGAPDGNAQTNTPPAELAGLASFAFPTLVTNGLGHTWFTQYDYYLGKPVDQEDPNGVASSFFYNDRLDRPTQQIRAVGVTADRSQTSFSYNSTGRTITTRSDLNSYGDNQLKTELVHDGLGRTVETRQYETGTAYIATVQTYDALGRVEQMSNPYRPASESQVRTTTQYDALGRVTRVTRPDGAVTTTSYFGNTATMTDPAGKSRRHVTDALGRLTALVEAPAGENLSTTYLFDALDNLLRVTQGAQTRSFAYDGLSRLTSATNPESGSVGYQYDSAGNLTRKTDARGTVTSLTYDDLNRLTNRNYSVTGGTAATPNVAYNYGEAPGSCGGYAKGRLCSVSSTASSTNYTYDNARGLVTRSIQETAGQAFNFSYVHNRAGHVVSQTYPSGRVIVNVIDAAGRVARVQQQGGNYYAGDAATDVQYASHGGIRQMKLGNGLWSEARFNIRLQPLQIGLGTLPTGLAANLTTTNSNRLLLEFGYGTTSNNGNLRSQSIRIGSTAISQTYVYADGMNRLTSASETSAGAPWSQIYGHDRYGNHWVSAGANYGNVPALVPQSQSELSAVSNQLTMGSYDTAGNLITDATGRIFKYDAENRQTGYVAGVASLNATYDYDGDGRRVKKLQDGVTTIFIYDSSGRLSAEYSSAPSGTGVSYPMTDHLGSTRTVTDSSGAIQSRHDYFPFGEEIASGLGNRSSIAGYTTMSQVRQKFAGKERDSETSLDFFGARYLNAAPGRFMSPDPHDIVTEASGQEEFTAFLGNPQNWNRYTYVLNSPLSITDPDGRCPTCLLWLQQLAQRAAPYANRALLAGQRFGQQAMQAARQGYMWFTQASNSPAGQEATSAAAELLTGAQLPYGFGDAAQFEQFGRTISSGLQEVAGEGVEAFLTGSAITGKNSISGTAFDVGRTSDFDIALVSGSLLGKAKEAGIELRGKGARTEPLSTSEKFKKLGLESLAQRLSLLAGRPVHFMIYESEEELRRRGAPYQRLQ